jgi:hypothetical protein
MLYAGVAYSKVEGGMAYSYIKPSTYSPAVGLRLTF